jgi:hypothetical protein
MVAEIWESRNGSWFGQLVEERTGLTRSKLFEAKSRSGVIAYIDDFYHQAGIAFCDRLRPTEI